MKNSRKVDLHTHTVYSDGSLDPAALVELAKAKNLSCIAITDHDNTNGVEEAQAAGKRLGIEVIAGAEMSVSFEEGGMHLLGYFLDVHNKALCDGLEAAQESRRRRNLGIAERLCSLGMPVSLEEARKKSGWEQVGRLHFAAVMTEKGYAQNFEEAFRKYLGRECPAYVDRVRMRFQEAIEMINQAGGIAVLAHPGQLKAPEGKGFESQIAALQERGLAGLEVYSSSHSSGQADYYKRVADRFNLVATGGSDFHGAAKPGVELGWMGEGASLSYGAVELLRSRIRNACGESKKSAVASGSKGEKNL